MASGPERGIHPHDFPKTLLLDLGLPAGDGISVLTRIKAAKELQAVPVIVVSGRTAAKARTQALDLGASAFFEKPAPEEVLIETIEALV